MHRIIIPLISTALTSVAVSYVFFDNPLQASLAVFLLLLIMFQLMGILSTSLQNIVQINKVKQLTQEKNITCAYCEAMNKIVMPSVFDEFIFICQSCKEENKLRPRFEVYQTTKIDNKNLEKLRQEVNAKLSKISTKTDES